MFIRQRISLSLAPIGLILLAAVGPVQASTIFTDFGSGFANNAAAGSDGSEYLTITGSTTTPGYTGIASPFTPAQDGTVTSVDLLLAYAATLGANDEVTVGIYSDSSDNPGSLIGVTTIATVTDTISNFSAPGPTPLDVSISGVSITGGSQYWVVLLPFNNATFVGWYFDPNAANSDYSETSTPGGGNWALNGDGGSPQVYFDVNGTQTGGGGGGSSSTPEPATLALVGFGLGALVLQRRRRIT